MGEISVLKARVTILEQRVEHLGIWLREFLWSWRPTVSQTYTEEEDEVEESTPMAD